MRARRYFRHDASVKLVNVDLRRKGRPQNVAIFVDDRRRRFVATRFYRKYFHCYAFRCVDLLFRVVAPGVEVEHGSDLFFPFVRYEQLQTRRRIKRYLPKVYPTPIDVEVHPGEEKGPGEAFGKFDDLCQPLRARLGNLFRRQFLTEGELLPIEVVKGGVKSLFRRKTPRTDQGKTRFSVENVDFVVPQTRFGIVFEVFFAENERLDMSIRGFSRGPIKVFF